MYLYSQLLNQVIWSWSYSLSYYGRWARKANAYASRTLNAAERHYSQLDCEGLAIIFGVKKFHNYLYGRHFTIGSNGITVMASSQIHITLAAYQYNIRYKSGKTLNNADALSRLPQPVITSADNYWAQSSYISFFTSHPCPLMLEKSRIGL